MLEAIETKTYTMHKELAKTFVALLIEEGMYNTYMPLPDDFVEIGIRKDEAWRGDDALRRARKAHEEAYIINGATRCPICNSNKITPNMFVSNGDGVYYQMVLCDECDTMWTDYYILDRAEIET
jgi:hypothetical protein